MTGLGSNISLNRFVEKLLNVLQNPCRTGAVLFVCKTRSTNMIHILFVFCDRAGPIMLS